eukprot:scaffold66381_cov63-Phaeocystis_antarctica.AAC.8
MSTSSRRASTRYACARTPTVPAVPPSRSPSPSCRCRRYPAQSTLSSCCRRTARLRAPLGIATARHPGLPGLARLALGG